MAGLGDLVGRLRRHPAWSAAGAAALSAGAEAAVGGSQSYAAAAARAMLFGHATVPNFVWLVAGPLCAAGVLWARERLRPPATPDHSNGVRWECRWRGDVVVSLRPVCPDPDCGRGLTVTPGGGRYGDGTTLRCPACGFRVEARYSPQRLRSEARLELEEQAGRHGGPPRRRIEVS